MLKLLREVGLGIYYLHCFEPPVLHLDLKSANVLLDENGVAKVRGIRGGGQEGTERTTVGRDAEQRLRRGYGTACMGVLLGVRLKCSDAGWSYPYGSVCNKWVDGDEAEMIGCRRVCCSRGGVGLGGGI